MSSFVIEGGKKLAGSVEVQGSKNAALPLLAASLLTEEEILLSNIPDISDVDTMLQILQAWGVEVEHDDGEVRLRARQVKTDGNVDALIGNLRGSILLMGALLGRQGRVSLPLPGGDVIGARPIDAHLDAFAQLGAKIENTSDSIAIDGTDMRAGEVVLPEFSVTATENVLLAAAKLPGTTTIYTAAAEPHVAALGNLLRKMGANIDGLGTHTISITGRETLGGGELENIPDMLEAGFFMLLAAACASEITVRNVPTEDLRLFLKKIQEIGLAVEETAEGLRVRPEKLSAFDIQVLPHPGIATDLQAPFAVLATQTAGSNLIHDPLYESRFKHVDELIKMGADAVVCDPHRVIINGITPLMGREIYSLDIRSGATLIMAGLVADGVTTIHDAEIVDRGYAKLVERLQGLGAYINRGG